MMTNAFPSPVSPATLPHRPSMARRCDPLAQQSATGGLADSWLGPVDRLLRDRAGLLADIDARDNLLLLGRAMLIAIAISAAVFGVGIGFYRGGIQVLFAAVKLPLVVLLTAALCAPVLTAARAALQGRGNLRADLALVLSALGLGSMLLAASTPVVLLAIIFDVGYHGLALLVVLCCLVSGAAGLSLLLRGIFARGGRGRLMISATVIAVFFLVGSQMTWTLRPYLVRPQTVSVPFARQVEGSLFDSILLSLDSAQGAYHDSPDANVW